MKKLMLLFTVIFACLLAAVLQMVMWYIRKEI